MKRHSVFEMAIIISHNNVPFKLVYSCFVKLLKKLCHGDKYSPSIMGISTLPASCKLINPPTPLEIVHGVSIRMLNLLPVDCQGR